MGRYFITSHIFTMPEIVLGIIELLLLIIGAYSDIRKRLIPIWVSIPMMAIGGTILILNKQYFLFAFWLISIYATRGTTVKVVEFIAAVCLYAYLGNSALPFIVYLLAADLLFTMKFIGGGDAQLLYGILAFLYSDWTAGIFIVCATVLVSVFLSFRKFGLLKSVKRLKTVGSGFLKYGEAEKDTERIRSPYAVTLAIAMTSFALVQTLYTL